MSIWFVRYHLTPRRRLSAIARPGAREGALLRAAGGFADVHPWPELGDATLDEQLALLARGQTTALTAASLRLAALDGEARRRGVSLFEGLTIPESHWPGDDPPEGFDTVKLKGAALLPPHVRLRLDFNNTLTPAETVQLASTLPRDRVDFLEDPCPYDDETWQSLRAQTGLRLALDRLSKKTRGARPSPAAGPTGVPPVRVPVHPQSGQARRLSTLRAGTPALRQLACDVLILKPALQQDWPAFNGEIVVTSYMDHPVGQLGAAYVAATHDVSPRCGLFTHVLYESDPFLERVRSDGARLLPPEGTGVGFDDLLEALPWRTLA